MKIFDGKIKGTMLVMFLLKITAFSNFTLLAIVEQINRIHERCCKYSVLSYSHYQSSVYRSTNFIILNSTIDYIIATKKIL